MSDTEVIYKFSELSESAKQAARDEYTGPGYLEYEWWDDVYEDAVWVAEILGITISTTEHAGRKPGMRYTTTDISFSGFSSQGDGACFEGWYNFKPDAIAKISAETNDEELLRIATELYKLQLARRISGLDYFSARVTTGGHYSHSGTMDVTVHFEEEVEYGFEELEGAVTQLMRQFADWIYKQLEAQYDYLHSDECIDQYLEEKDFDEDGSEIES